MYIIFLVFWMFI